MNRRFTIRKGKARFTVLEFPSGAQFVFNDKGKLVKELPPKAYKVRNKHTDLA